MSSVIAESADDAPDPVAVATKKEHTRAINCIFIL